MIAAWSKVDREYQVVGIGETQLAAENDKRRYYGELVITGYIAITQYDIAEIQQGNRKLQTLGFTVTFAPDGKPIAKR